MARQEVRDRRRARRAVGTQPLDGLLAGLRLGLGTGEHVANQAMLVGVTDWNAVIRLAKRHRVLSLLRSGLRASTSLASSPEAAARLARLHRQQARRGLVQLEALKQATRCLAENGIASLVLKGFPLGQRLFNHPLARHAGDIDLLVSPGAVVPAERTLAASGWHLLQPNVPQSSARSRWYDRLVNAHVLIGPSGLLELHHRLLSNPFLFGMSFERLHENSSLVKIGRYPFRTLGDDDLWPYLIIHGQAHYWYRFKWLCDIVALLTSMDGECFARMAERCRKEKLECALASTMLLCREAFHVEIPDAAGRLSLEGRRTLFFVRFSRASWSEPKVSQGWRGIRRRIAEHWVGMFMKPDLRSALYEFSRFFIGPYEFDKLDVSDRLFFLHVLLRPFFWLRKWSLKR